MSVRGENLMAVAGTSGVRPRGESVAVYGESDPGAVSGRMQLAKLTLRWSHGAGGRQPRIKLNAGNAVTSANSLPVAQVVVGGKSVKTRAFARFAGSGLITKRDSALSIFIDRALSQTSGFFSPSRSSERN